MRYKRAVLLAAIGSTLPLLWLLLIFFSVAVATLQFRGFSMRLLVPCLPSLAMTVFLVSLYREASGLTSADGRRRASMVAAVVMLLGTLLNVLTPYGSVNMKSGLHVLLASSLIHCAAWTTFYGIFAREAAPLSKRRTSNFAALLAALTVLQELINNYGLCIQLIRGRLSLKNVMHVGFILPQAMATFGWVSLLVFLVVVWRYRPAPPAPGDRAQETV